MTTVRVEAPARLHMGMLDASGAGARRFGGLGVAVERPAVVVEASPSDDLTVEGAEVERALAVAERCHAALGLTTGARVRVLEAIPSHVGLGSGTKLALAVTAAFAALAERSPDPAVAARVGARSPDAVAAARLAGSSSVAEVAGWSSDAVAAARLAGSSSVAEVAGRSPDAGAAARVGERSPDAAAAAPVAGWSTDAEVPGHVAGLSPDPLAMARMAGRGARSAVGLWTFALGGLVVEGGVHRENAQAAPLLVRHAMPDEWRCVLAIPAAEPGLSGGAEAAAFARLRPDPDRSALISQIVLTTLLPALVERDLVEFGAALTRLQRLVGDAFAPVQGGTFHPQAGRLVEALLRHGAAGAGQSSWGPAVYGIVGSERDGYEVARRLESELGSAGRAEVVAFDNRGARVKEVA